MEERVQICKYLIFVDVEIYLEDYKKIPTYLVDTLTLFFIAAR